MLARYADPNALLRLGKTRLTRLVATASNNHLGAERAEQWLTAAAEAVALYGTHPAVAYLDLAAEVATEVRLLRAIQAELAGHAQAREQAYRYADLGALVYHTQMVERGKDHLGAVCVVAAHLAERAWAVLSRGMPYVICDTDATPVSPARAKAIIAERYTVPAEVRARRRSKKTTKAARPLTKSTVDMATTLALEAQSRGDLPHHHPHHRPAHRSSHPPPDPAAPSLIVLNAGVVERPNPRAGPTDNPAQPRHGPPAGQPSTNTLARTHARRASTLTSRSSIGDQVRARAAECVQPGTYPD